MRGATGNVPLVRIGGFISIHAPRAGCDFLATLQAPGKRISIHAPRAGCDNPYKVVTLWDNDFNPRTPCGVRRYKAAFVWRRENFNPRTPCGVRLSCLLPRAIRAEISIHAPRAGCDLPTELTFLRLYHFNPRTPCGVRRSKREVFVILCRFQSTHPVRGATGAAIAAPFFILYFNPRTPCGVRLLIPVMPMRGQQNFNPRTPCGVRPYGKVTFKFYIPFQSTHPVRGATGKKPMDHRQLGHFNPRTPCGVRRGRWSCAIG